MASSPSFGGPGGGRGHQATPDGNRVNGFIFMKAGGWNLERFQTTMENYTCPNPVKSSFSFWIIRRFIAV